MDEILRRVKEDEQEVMMQCYSQLPVAFVRGEGVWLWDSAGKRYLDLVSGIGVVILGHCQPEVTEAIVEQSQRLVHTTNLYYIIPQVELARTLVDNSFADRAFFCNSGAEANEAALKLARKYHYERGKARREVVCLDGSFHGRTLATLRATGQPSKWEPFMPLVDWIEHVPPNDVQALETAVTEETSAILLEPVQGETGVHPIDYEFLSRARELCDEAGAVLIFDEIQTGLGRTGHLFAYEAYDVIPDVMTLAKGLANGLPIGAVLASEKIGVSFKPGDHGTTFGGNHLATAVAGATLRELLDGDVIGNVKDAGRSLHAGLDRLAEKSPVVRGTRGIGLMLAMDLEGVSSKEVTLRCLDEGLVVNSVTPGTIRFLPPLIITEDEIQEALAILNRVFASLERVAS